MMRQAADGRKKGTMERAVLIAIEVLSRALAVSLEYNGWTKRFAASK
jgi:hypothetical protein